MTVERRLGSSTLFEQLSVEASPVGISRVRFGWVSGRRDFRPAPESGSLEASALAQLREYLEGRRRHFDLPLDLGGTTPFRMRVLEELKRIPFGATVTYGEIAARIGCPSPRAVGQAVARNPIPIIIPCHRVVARDGRLGGFTGGLDRKVALLGVEGIQAAEARFQSPLVLR